MYFAITLKLNRREDFTNDLKKLRDALIYLKSFTVGTLAPYLFELQPKGLHNMHVHVCLETEYKFSYFHLHNAMKNKDINMDIRQIITNVDLAKWQYYCRKNGGDLAYQYAETTGSELNKIRIVGHNVPAQQMGEEDIGQCIGRYKNWI